MRCSGSLSPHCPLGAVLLRGRPLGGPSLLSLAGRSGEVHRAYAPLPSRRGSPCGHQPATALRATESSRPIDPTKNTACGELGGGVTRNTPGMAQHAVPSASAPACRGARLSCEGAHVALRARSLLPDTRASPPFLASNAVLLGASLRGKGRMMARSIGLITRRAMRNRPAGCAVVLLLASSVLFQFNHHHQAHGHAADAAECRSALALKEDELILEKREWAVEKREFERSSSPLRTSWSRRMHPSGRS